MDSIMASARLARGPMNAMEAFARMGLLSYLGRRAWEWHYWIALISGLHKVIMRDKHAS